MFKNTRKTNRAMTLVEVMVAVFILTVGILGALMFFTRAMTATEAAKELTVATTHAEYVMEEMRRRPTLADVVQADWVRWAEQEKILTLPFENIAVICENPGADPLRVQTTMTWKNSGRVNKVALSTELTK